MQLDGLRGALSLRPVEVDGEQYVATMVGKTGFAAGGAGFRVGAQCVQGLYNIKPDLTTLGKVIGGGLPVGAFGGRADIMDKLDGYMDAFHSVIVGNAFGEG